MTPKINTPTSIRKKFPGKPISEEERKKKNAALKRIRRDYERQHAEIERGGPPMMKKGMLFYAIIIFGLLAVGTLVLSKTGDKRPPQPTKAQINVRKSIDALAVALGRYRYHVGTYPSTAEGLEILAATRVAKMGWDGPYIRQVVKDPWKHDYVYEYNGEAATPTLYSKGADGVAGTTDDVLPDPALFDEPFRDTSWTKGWMPWHLRGIMVVQNEDEKKVAEERVARVRQEEEDEAAQKVGIEVGMNAATERVLELFKSDDSVCQFDGEVGCMRPVHICPHWNFEVNEGETVEICCIADDCDEAEMFLDGQSLGRHGRDAENRLVWNVPYQPGELKAIAYRAGNYAGEAVRTTAFKPDGVRLTATRNELTDNESCLVGAALIDDRGVFCPTSSGVVTWRVEGPGVLLAQSADFYKGIAKAVVKRIPGSGLPVKIVVTAPNGRSATLLLPRLKLAL